MLTGGQPLVIDVDKEPALPSPTRILDQGHIWTSFIKRREYMRGKMGPKLMSSMAVDIVVSLAMDFAVHAIQ